MPKITKIESQKKRAGRVNVYVDEEFAFGLPEKLLIDFDIYKGKEVSQAEIERYKAGNDLSKCLDKAYRFLSYRPRSEKEIRDKLIEKYPDTLVEEAVAKLKDYNFVNDDEFARMWVNSRSSGRSARALAFELKNKGVAKEVIEKALLDIDSNAEFESALALVSSKTKYQGLERDAAYKKIGGFLSRRGYNYEIIKKVIYALHE